MVQACDRVQVTGYHATWEAVRTPLSYLVQMRPCDTRSKNLGSKIEAACRQILVLRLVCGSEMGLCRAGDWIDGGNGESNCRIPCASDGILDRRLENVLGS